jgi:hypothetical protein
LETLPVLSLNGVEIRCLPHNPDARVTTASYEMVPPADFNGLRSLMFTIDWSVAPEDMTTNQVLANAAKRAVHAVRTVEPRWMDAYCG